MPRRLRFTPSRLWASSCVAPKHRRRLMAQLYPAPMAVAMACVAPAWQLTCSRFLGAHQGHGAPPIRTLRRARLKTVTDQRGGLFELWDICGRWAQQDVTLEELIRLGYVPELN